MRSVEFNNRHLHIAIFLMQHKCKCDVPVVEHKVFACKRSQCPARKPTAGFNEPCSVRIAAGTRVWLTCTRSYNILGIAVERIGYPSKLNV